LSDLKGYGSHTWSSRNNFELQMKRSNEKIVRRKIAFQLTKHFFFSFFLFFFLFGPFLLSKFLTFSFLVHFKWFKVLYRHHLQLYTSYWNFNNNRATYKEIFGWLGLCVVMFDGLFFLSFWGPLLWGL
jgi:hypothetical protein